jgi:hypothetical protein
MGYADEMIDGMNRAEAEAELGTAAEQGIEPGEEEAAEPAGVPEAAEGEKPDAARDTNAPDEGGKSPAVDFSDLLPDGSRRSPAKITDQADIERAGAKVNTSPSEAQKEAGNYQKGHLKWKGLDFTIENPAGSIRSGKDADGTPWQAQLPAAYGYIKRTTGRDGDHVDVYFQGDGPIHVIDQIDPKTGKFDEHKVVIGPQTAEEASALYRSAFNDGDTVNRIGAITELTPSKLKAWLRIGKRTRPLGIIAKPAQETDKTGLSQIGEGGRAIVDNMYDAMWSRVEKGLTTEAGNQPSALMQAAKRVRDAGGLRTRDDFIALAHDYAGIERGPTFQADMRALVQRHMPAVPPVAAGDPPLAPGHVRLYRGEAQGRNEANGGYYSTDREMASGFGKLRYVDLPADAAAFFKMPGMGGKIYNLTDYEAGPGNVNWRARSKPLVAEETSEPESMAPTGGAPTQDELHGEPSGTTDAAKAVDDALAAIGIPSEQVDATDLSAAAKIVEETGAEPAAAFVQVMADQLEETTDAADSAGTVSDGLEEGKSGGQQAEGEQLPGRSEAGGEATQGDSAVEGAEPDRTGNAENAEDGATGDAAEAENAGVAAKPTEAEEKAASDAIEGALNKIEEAVEAKDRAGVLAAARAARKVLSDTPQAIKDAEPEYWGQFSAVIRRMAKPGYVTATQEAKAAEADVQAADTEEPTTTAFVPTALDKPATEDENKARIEDAGEKLGGARNRTATLADTFATHLSEGGEFKNILAARKMAKEAGFNADAKAVEEAMELGVVQLARQIVADRSDPKANFTALVDLYSRQPKLGTRTSTSMRDQAFSTPVPLAYVASRLAEIGPETTVYEPTAGNGALLIEANPAKATANEINEARAANLISLGFKVTQDNAVGTGPRHGSVQAVIANPPFGAVRQEGSSQVYDLSDIQKGYKTKEIDHAIALRALQTMKDDGRAVLIIGGLNKLLTSPEARSDAYNSKAKREFFKTLYDRYNVSDHFTVAGELYERQGAGWPVDVIVIDGRGKSERSLPAVDVPRVLTSWDQLGGLIDVSGRSDSATDRTADGTAGAGPGERDGRGRGDGERVSEPDAGSQQPGEVQPGSVQRPADERSRGEGPAESAGNERGDAERTGDEPPASGRPPGLTAEEAVDAALDELLGPQAGPKSSESPIGLDNVSSRRTSGDEVTFGKFKGYASTNDGGRLSVDAYGATAAEAQKNAVAKLNREFSERAAKRTPPVRTTPQVAASAATNAVASADAAFSGLYQLFGAGKTAGTLGAFDESTYAKAKPLFMQAAEKFAAFKNDIGELAKRMVTHMRDALKWPTEAIARMRPYLIQFIKDVQSGAVSLTQAKTETKAPAAKATEQETDKQVAYAPQSKSGGLGTLVPVNMRSSIQEALARIEKKVGPLDTYVAKELGYETDENGMPYFERDGENVFPFAAEQIDAIALAIDNINRDKGFIIGDQTGIGKGRVNAGILRWAMMNDRIPIFVSAKPNLYGDMYRDLSDIGIQESLGHDLRILATNSGLNVPLTEDDKPVVLKTGDAVAHKKALNAVTGENFTDNYDVLFTTYNQMQTVAGKDTDRRGLLQRLGSNAVLAFDESHEAGGQGAKARKTEKGPDNRADFARDLIKKAKGVFYSSATYAKRPDVMDLYAATDMSMAVEKAEDLGEAIARGGVPMQQVVAAMLAKAGQYIRRERSFAGVTYATPIIPVNRELYDQISGVLASIQDFSVIVQGAADNMDADIKAQAEAHGARQRRRRCRCFKPAVHLDHAQRHQPDAARAQSRAGGEDGNRGVEERSEAGHHAREHDGIAAVRLCGAGGLKPGDVINADFGSVLTKYLDRTRTLIIKKPFSKDPVERKYLTDEELGAEGLAAYNSAKAQIESIAGLSDLPASPIDRIKQDLADAGYKVGEITGRGTTIDYSGDEPVLRNRPGAEMSIRGRRETLQKFNNGGLDGMILNQAGSTGLSAHASEKYKDQRQRHMMIAQAEGNIDTHMQMLGRVHRTGQVVVPTYSQLVADIPAEKRPAAVLAKKMASLNANTTASREGALTSKDVPDFINQYGDMIAATIIADDLALNHRLGNAIKIDENGRVTVEDAMRRLTGRIPLLPLGEQEELYSGSKPTTTRCSNR